MGDNEFSQPVASETAALEREIRHHNQLYWNQNEPAISDTDYDRLVRRLRELAPDSPVLEEIGAGAETPPVAEAVTHDPPMLSLDKCYGQEELQKWADKIEGDFVVTPKMDGIAAAIRYDAQGRLTLAATRGSGRVGENITANVRRIKDVPNRIAHGPLEVRGEIYMRLSVFEQFKGAFSNPRNLTAGAIKQKEADKSAAYKLSFAAYDARGVELPDEESKCRFLEEMGFAKIERQRVEREHLQEAYERVATRRAEYDFEIDGVVFKANDVAVQAELGATAHHPRYAIAYKFQGDQAITTLKEIQWSVSRSGILTPVAHVEPVELSGAVVSRASLHNAGFLDKLQLARGARVMTTRRGGVIPKVEFVVEPGTEPFHPPTRCPSCDGETRRVDDILYCAHPEACPDVVVGILAHYAAVCEMEGFGEKSLRDAFKKGILRSPVDFYRLDKAALLQLERTGEKTADNLMRQIEARRRLPLAVFLRALGLSEIGPNVAEILVKTYKTLDRIRSVQKDELAALYSVGDIIAGKVVHGLKEKAPLIEALLEHVTVIEETDAAVEGGTSEAGGGPSRPFAGKSFVFTGTLEAMGRKEAAQQVQALGAATPSSVTNDLSYLVCGAEKSGRVSNKQKKAEILIADGADLKILNEAEFLTLLQQGAQAPPPESDGKDDATVQLELF